ncbi:hypothetical protein QP096_08035, partial [Alloscardovia omnicolens]|uniref:hypothetical protein n=1 Tax=Alloscardovia omnicolens TaxID=419015 RepID=UPI00254D55DF
MISTIIATTVTFGILNLMLVGEFKLKADIINSILLIIIIISIFFLILIILSMSTIVDRLRLL